MLSGFQPNVEVVEPALLFGHNTENGLLHRFASKLRLGANTQIIGERRIGKTSMLKCASVVLHDRTPAILPIYLNFRQHGQVRGYVHALRLLLSYIHVAVAKFLDDEVAEKCFAETGLKHSDDPKKSFQQLKAASGHEIEGLIEHHVLWLNGNGFGIVLLFDEYESMMSSTFEGVSGSFFFIRDLSARGPTTPGAPKPLTYAIAGSIPWRKLCERIGSPEFNNTGEMLYVPPISEISFNEMWGHCLAASSDTIRDRVQHSFPDASLVYDLTGGWPFYGKLIGHFAATEPSYDQDDLYELLGQHFEVSWLRILGANQQSAFRPGQPSPPSMIRDLKKRGLICEDRTSQAIAARGSLWSRYVEEQVESVASEAHKVSSAGHGILEDCRIELIGDEVVDLVTTINENCSHKKRHMVFEPTNSDYRIYQVLRTPVHDRDSFSFFAANSYLLLFERTIIVSKRNRSIRLGRLPDSFRKTHPLIQEVDALRHEYGNAHLTHVDSWRPGKNAIPVSSVLQKYLGNTAAPVGSQFTALQQGLLVSLRDYLHDLNEHILS